MMGATREQEIIRAFVGVSHELASGYDVVDMMSTLTADCARLLDVAAAAMLLADGRGVLHLAAASSERSRNLELFQLQRDEGPCLDCYRTGSAVVSPDLAAEAQRWPQFCQAAQELGFASVHALPMRLRDTVLGAVGLFGNEVGRLDDDDLELAQALVHVASVSLVNEKAATDSATVQSQLQHALVSRIAIEQAKGVLANHAGLDMDDAFTVLRRYARDNGRKLGEVAAELVNREMTTEKILTHARSSGVKLGS